MGYMGFNTGFGSSFGPGFGMGFGAFGVMFTIMFLLFVGVFVVIIVRGNSKWLSYITTALDGAKTFEIHCWNEETEWIELALQYGNLKEDDWQYGKIVSGDVTPAFAQMLLGQPKPSDTEIYNKMTPFFNVFLDGKFQSCHYGTELYL